MMAAHASSISSSMQPEVDPVIGREIPFTLTASAGRPASEGAETIPEPGVTSLGKMEQDVWRYEVSRSKLLVSDFYSSHKPFLTSRFLARTGVS